MSRQGHSQAQSGLRRYALRANLEALFALALIGLAAWTVATASAGSATTRLIFTPGKIVPVPASVPHEAGDMVDRRIVPDLVWLSEHFPIYVTDGYSGPLPNGTHVGCNRCHTRHSDHYNGLAVDLVPVGGTPGKCDRTWTAITKLAHWAEPTQNHPIAPFRWVGYDGDAGHGCGNHLHLSWNHSETPEFQLAEWVEVLPVGLSDTISKPPQQPSGRAPKAAKGPPGGISQAETGGLGPRRD